MKIPLYLLDRVYQRGGSQHNYAPNFDQEEIGGIVLGGCENLTTSDIGYYDGIFIMVVQNKGAHFERVGYMIFSKHEWKAPGAFIDFSQLCGIILRFKKRQYIRLG